MIPSLSMNIRSGTELSYYIVSPFKKLLLNIILIFILLEGQENIVNIDLE